MYKEAGGELDMSQEPRDNYGKILAEFFGERSFSKIFTDNEVCLDPGDSDVFKTVFRKGGFAKVVEELRAEHPKKS